MAAMETPTPEAIKALRKKHDLQQKEVGDMLYASRRTVQYWEDGTRAMPLASWELLNVRLGEMQPRPVGDFVKPETAVAKPVPGRKNKPA